MQILLHLLLAGPQALPAPEPLTPLGHEHLLEMPVFWTRVQARDLIDQNRGADGKSRVLLSSERTPHAIHAPAAHMNGLIAGLQVLPEPTTCAIPSDARMVLAWQVETGEIRMQMGYYFETPAVTERGVVRPRQDGRRVSYSWKQTPEGSVTTNAAGEVVSRMQRPRGEPPPFFEAMSCFPPASAAQLDLIEQAGVGRLSLKAIPDAEEEAPTHLLRFQPFESLDQPRQVTVATSADGKTWYVWFE
jgi:hypothetical protein